MYLEEERQESVRADGLHGESAKRHKHCNSCQSTLFCSIGLISYWVIFSILWFSNYTMPQYAGVTIGNSFRQIEFTNDPDSQHYIVFKYYILAAKWLSYYNVTDWCGWAHPRNSDFIFSGFHFHSSLWEAKPTPVKVLLLENAPNTWALSTMTSQNVCSEKRQFTPHISHSSYLPLPLCISPPVVDIMYSTGTYVRSLRGLQCNGSTSLWSLSRTDSTVADN